MKQILIAAIVALSATFFPAAYAAAPNHATISQQVKSGQYATLLERYKAGQKLTADEAAIVYFGSALQPGFQAEKDYNKMLAAYNTGQTDNAFRLCEEALATDPTNLLLLYKAYGAAMVSKDSAIKAKAPKMQARLLTVCDAIENSGTGVSESSPYMVIRPSDTEEFLNKYMQPSAINGRATIGNLSAAKVKLDGIADDVILYFSTFK